MSPSPLPTVKSEDAPAQTLKDHIKADNLAAFKEMEKQEGGATSADGISIIHRVANAGADKILFYLLSTSPDLSVLPDADGIHPLHYASASRKSSTVSLLLTYPIVRQNVNAQDDLGYTALHAAIYASEGESNSVVVEKLLENGATGNISSSDGIHPFDLATSFNDTESADLIAASLGGVVQVQRVAVMANGEQASPPLGIKVPIPQPPTGHASQMSSQPSSPKRSPPRRTTSGSPRKTTSPKKAVSPRKSVKKKSKTPAKKEKKEKPDGPPKPRKSLSAYNYFFSEQSKKRKQSKEKGATFSQQGTAMGELWKRLAPPEREPFLKLAAEDSKRYAKDKAELTETWLAVQTPEARDAWLQRTKSNSRRSQQQQSPRVIQRGTSSNMNLIQSNTTSASNTTSSNSSSSRARGMSIFSSSNNSTISDNRIDLLSNVAHVLDHVESKKSSISSSSLPSQIMNPLAIPLPLKSIQVTSTNPLARSPSPHDSVSMGSTSLGSLMNASFCLPPSNMHASMPPPSSSIAVPRFTFGNTMMGGQSVGATTRDSFNSLRGGSLAERSRGSISMGSLGGHSLTEALNNAGLMEEDGDWGE